MRIEGNELERIATVIGDYKEDLRDLSVIETYVVHSKAPLKLTDGAKVVLIKCTDESRKAFTALVNIIKKDIEEEIKAQALKIREITDKHIPGEIEVKSTITSPIEIPYGCLEGLRDETDSKWVESHKGFEDTHAVQVYVRHGMIHEFTGSTEEVLQALQNLGFNIIKFLLEGANGIGD